MSLDRYISSIDEMQGYSGLPKTKYGAKEELKTLKENAKRVKFQEGRNYDIEDETRYQASKLGSLGSFPTVAPFTPEAAAKPSPAASVSQSTEIQQAKDRVKSYENDILSGKTSNDIYGKSNQLAQPQQTSFTKPSNDSSADYKLDLSNSQTAAQSQLKDYLSKYSKFKSNN